MLPAENLLHNTPSDELIATSQARQQSEARLGQAAASVRRNLDETVTESLGLQVSAPPLKE